MERNGKTRTEAKMRHLGGLKSLGRRKKLLRLAFGNVKINEELEKRYKREWG